MRQIKIPNSSATELGVELDKTLSDGTKALGIVQILDGQSPFKPDDILLRVNAWQVRPDGRIVQREGSAFPTRVAIREILVQVPRGEYTHIVADQQIAIAAAALALIATDLPGLAAPALPATPVSELKPAVPTLATE